jgi:uncharacterized protein (UPF0335 family)
VSGLTIDGGRHATASPPPPEITMSTKADNPRAVAGDNSGAAEPAVTKFAKDALKAYVERVERLEDERDTFKEDIRSVYAEAKSHGYDVKVLRKVIARRKRDRNEVAEEDALLDTYEHALGVFG